MARARSIKPGFFQNEQLAELPPLTRILFAGLWTLADRAGRLEDRPKRIKIGTLPYDNCNVDKMLNDLRESGFIVRYEQDGNRFIAIPTWDKHQNPHCKEPASTIPAPCENSARTMLDRNEHSSKTADSLNPEPLTLNPEPGVWCRNGSPNGKYDPQPLWEFVQGLYPKHRLNPHMDLRLLIDIATPDVEATIRRDLPKRVESEAWRRENGKFVPKASKYLGERLFDVPLEPERADHGELPEFE